MDTDKLQLGDILPAQNVHGRNLQEFNDIEDIAWALEVHVKRPDLSPQNVKAVLITGNEDAPITIWVAREAPILLGTDVELVYLD